ncbi:MAG: acetyl-CoA acetyltransferase family protein [Lysobacterales bacterium]|jgi:acetyl-CoA acetyltransferase family protein
MERIAVVSGYRTPFCKMGTYFNDLGAEELGRVVVRELLERTSFDPKHLDEVIFGCVGQPADAANIARVIALLAGIPKEVPAFTVHRNCASGIEAAAQAMIKIRAGEGSCYLVGGAESMSNIPFYFQKSTQEWFMLLQRAKTPLQKLGVLSKFRLSMFAPKIGLQLGLTDPVCGLIMGLTAENLARDYGITREEQDEFSLMSHKKAMAARNVLSDEIVPVIPGKRYKKVVEHDNGPRDGQTIEALQKLKPYFDRRSGSVTVGNSSQITDGAAALLVMTEAKAKELNMDILGYIKDISVAGVEPSRMGIGPAHAIPQVLKKTNMALSDFKAIEINEAFAAQVIACVKALQSPEFTKEFGYEGFTGKIDSDILNPNGGAIALGHPVGTTGARLILSMLKHMQRKNLQHGLVSLCIGGGQGAAVVLER